MTYKVISEAWSAFVDEVDDTPNYDVPTFKLKVEISIAKGRGGNKQETMAEIRAIPSVTVLSTEPGTVRDDETYSHIVYNLAFVYNAKKHKTPRQQLVLILNTIKALESVSSVKIHSNMERVDT